MIEISNLVKRYGDITAVNDISFHVKKGEIVGFLGPNGAGKSTTMNILTGYISATSGSVKIAGHDILESPLEAKRHIGYLPENPPLYLDMTVLEYLKFVAELKGVPHKQILAEVANALNLVRIKDVAGRLIGNLSKGYKQRVGIAQALIGHPDVLILDEPTVGLDPKQIIEIRNTIRQLGKQHTIILSSHILPEVSAVCDRVLIINKGQIVASDDLLSLSQRTRKKGQIEITVAAEPSALEAALKRIPEIADLTFVREQDGLSTYRYAQRGHEDPRPAVFFEMSKQQWPIYDTHSLEPTLEDIFLQVTGSSMREIAPKNHFVSSLSSPSAAADEENLLHTEARPVTEEDSLEVEKLETSEVDLEVSKEEATL